MNKRFVVECKNCDRILTPEEVESKAGFCHSCFSKARITTETYRQLRYGTSDILNVNVPINNKNNVANSNYSPKKPSR